MIYCLSGSQTKEYLLFADEVMIPYSKLHYIPELLHLREGQVRIVIQLDTPDINWGQLKSIYDSCSSCQVMLNSVTDVANCAAVGISNYFFSFLIRDFYTLNYYITLGICAARIAPPLTHYLPALAGYNIEIRAFVNSSGAIIEDDPNNDGIIGGWFRPEDMSNPLVTQAIQVAEFKYETLEQEQALWRIYSKGEWPGELAYIVPSVHDKDILNRALPPTFVERRGNCGQRCQRPNSTCHYCHMMCNFAKLDVMQKVKTMYKPSGE